MVTTGNQETIYPHGVTTLGDEPMVFEIAPKTLGFMADAWQPNQMFGTDLKSPF